MVTEASYLDLRQAVERLKRHISIPAERTARPALILISGLPGTGKSHLSREIARQMPCLIIETDFVRKLLFRHPGYTGPESRFVYQVSQVLMADLLAEGVNIIFDATNLLERKREALYHLAEQMKVNLVIVRTVAPPEVVRRRLQQRTAGLSEADLSDADWPVYERFQEREERIVRSHLVIDTSQDLVPAVQKIVRLARR
ncbi:MAG: AAA family ATPase [Chloroflexi bacterium]|nr:AAA family ATPase [Chloroflexota bacterium]MCL5075093.1 AAA family ATPase [Chloroflexota bacterium]